MKSSLRHCLAIAAASLLAGCAAGPAPKIYLLDAPAPPSIGVRPETALPVIELRKVAVPDYLDSTDILRRTGPNEVTASPTGRWGERLSFGITDALASALSKRVPQAVISSAPESAPTERLSIHIERFDIGADGHCLVAARWQFTLRDARTPSKSAFGSFDEAAGSADDSAVVAAMTRVIGQLADQIAASIDLK